MASPAWFITGASNGFGLLLCLRALKANHKVVGSVRSRAKAADAVRQIESAGGRVIELDLNEPKESIARKVKTVGQIDYLVNNAGFFILGAVEQVTDEEAQLQMQTNFFGPLYVTQAALEGMRQRRAGAVANLSSIAALDPQPASALYAASKAALEAVSAALAAEVAAFGVSVLVVEPGAFRTNFLAAHRAPAAALPADYAGTAAAAAGERFATQDGRQAGDPRKAVDRIYEALTGEGLAGKLTGKVDRLVIGPDALRRMRARNDKFLADLALGEDVALSTDF
ncbi:NAD(P)-binding protein [Hypoxylon cercidicola]|nr:NAD(P)-binding protein [Hypoxylon cercidicola]